MTITEYLKALHEDWAYILSDEKPITGWVHRPDGIWWHGNGNIKPKNWSKMFEEAKKLAPIETQKPKQLTLFD